MTHAERTELLARFDAAMRRDPPVEAGIWIERSGPIVRVRGAHNLIAWWRLTAAEVDAAVRHESAFFASSGASVEWKVYGHDGPDGLSAALERHGFVADETETLMVCDLAARDEHAAAGDRPHIEMRRVVDAAGLADLVAVADAAFEHDHAWMFDVLPPRMAGARPLTAAFVAYIAQRPIAGGRLDLPADRPFASLWGGGTIPAARGRGAFSALVATRARHARAAGYRYLTVDARDSSRPILERLGFVALTPVTGWQFAPTSAS